MSASNSIRQTLIVALLLCLVCSIIVASAAVLLKPIQISNKLIDRNKNILSSAGLFDAQQHTNADVNRLFEQFDVRFLDIRSGDLLSDEQAQTLGLAKDQYNQRDAAKNPTLSIELTAQEDIASIGRQAKYILVYLLEENDQIKRMVLPVHGSGLWGTLYGFIAIENDANTIAGLAFYEHKETPGLGAKVDLPAWKALWPGKKIYADVDEQLVVKVSLAKGKAIADDPYQVDGLSGATLTTKGVSNLLQFWMGDLGYKPFLQKIKQQMQPSRSDQVLEQTQEDKTTPIKEMTEGIHS